MPAYHPPQWCTAACIMIIIIIIFILIMITIIMIIIIITTKIIMHALQPFGTLRVSCEQRM